MLGKVIIFLCLGTLAYSANIEDITSSVEQALQDYIANDFTPTESYLSTLQSLHFDHLFRREKEELPERSIICDACAAAIDTLIWIRNNGTSKEQILKFLIDSCVNLNIESYDVCKGALELNAEIILYIIDEKPEVDGELACALVLQNMGCESDNYAHWSLEIPPVVEPPNPELTPSGKALKVLQISDIHYDPVYTVGSATICNAPVCCEYDSGDMLKEDPGAGYWSEYNCDSPLWMITDSMYQISKRHTDLDFIYFTGDVISHRIWATDVYNNSKDITDIMKEFKNNFGDIPVYPIMGNHEPHPLNVWSSDGINNLEVSTKWVFELAAKVWLTWLPRDTKETILRGGYYTVELKPGFRLIALNSNVCYTFNWWLLYDDVDPYGQLQWLIDTLVTAEAANERVHIISHIPSGDGTCNTAWSIQFKRIVERYAHLITGIFNGHSHNDEMIVYFPENSTTEAAFSVAYNGASLTTYTNKNPSYKIYDVDADSFEVLDYVEWTFNVTRANLTPTKGPVWYELYSFKNAYGVEDMKPETIGELTEKMAVDHSLLEEYYRFKVREADTSMLTGCGPTCQKNMLCDMVTSVHNDKSRCDHLTSDWED